MKKKKKIDMKVLCDKCGKQAPVNKEQSNANWKVFDTKEPCECGGSFHMFFSDNKH